jgi:hypothetical protein
LATRPQPSENRTADALNEGDLVLSEGPLTLGWEEWVALPGLGLPAIKAKVDTGARTSALHARFIEPFGPASAPMVRFIVHPRPKAPDLAVACAAPICGRREVKSSNGEVENRFVIATPIEIAGRTWPIEVTLSNRDAMSYRMLLGRQAIKQHAVIVPQASFLQPKLGYRAYRKLARSAAVARPLRIALLSQRPRSPANRAIGEAAAARGHVVEIIDPAHLSLVLAPGQPGLAAIGGALGHYDAVLARARREHEGFVSAVVRQFELMGAQALNGSRALALLTDPHAVHQIVSAAGIATLAPAHIGPGTIIERTGTSASTCRAIVVDGRAVAHVASRVPEPQIAPALLAASAAARALGLGVAEVSMAFDDGRPVLAALSAAPALTRHAGALPAIAEAIVRLAETRVAAARGVSRD